SVYPVRQGGVAVAVLSCRLHELNAHYDWIGSGIRCVGALRRGPALAPRGSARRVRRHYRCRRRPDLNVPELNRSLVWRFAEQAARANGIPPAGKKSTTDYTDHTDEDRRGKRGSGAWRVASGVAFFSV